MSSKLFLFQIGPVQAFIAQARRTQDLYVGSHILSSLAMAGVKAAHKQRGFESLFPLFDGKTGTGGVPHRFAFICDEVPETVAQTVRETVHKAWVTEFANPVLSLLYSAVGHGAWEATFQRQMGDWLEFYWAAVPYDPAHHGECYSKASAALAQRKYARHYRAVEEPGVKCTLTGAQSALPLDWEKLRRHIHDDGIVLRDNEQLGTLALIKRLYEISTKQRFVVHSTAAIAADDPNADREPRTKKEVSGYLAVLHMDGDQMGKRVGGCQSLQAHREFSRQLAQFAAKHAKSVVEQAGGQAKTLVYAGGDDILVLLPLKHALTCAYELNRVFCEQTQQTASAGIAITPDDLPLDVALELMREAEHSAKHDYGRDAIVIVEAHSSGQMRQAGAKWDIIPFVHEVQILFEEHALSAKIAYDLQSFDQQLFGSLQAARAAELGRLLKRRTDEKATEQQKAKVMALQQKMIDLVESDRAIVPTWSDMANWLILARFLAQGGHT